jgi:hypothetical protein
MQVHIEDERVFGNINLFFLITGNQSKVEIESISSDLKFLNLIPSSKSSIMNFVITTNKIQN